MQNNIKSYGAFEKSPASFSTATTLNNSVSTPTTESAKPRCICCGDFLSVKNSYRQPEKIDCFTPYCLKCQPKMYTARAAMTGFKLAMFTCCLEFNVPYLPELLAEVKKFAPNGNPWKGYLIALAQHGHHNPQKMSGFKDGITDIRKAFDGSTETLYVEDSNMTADDYEDLQKSQHSMWGTGPEADPYSHEDWDFLDEQYSALTENRSYISQQTELTIKQICQYKLLAKRQMEIGEYASAKSINSMVKELMESEQLRKKDEIPEDRVRLDDIAIAVERAGLPVMDYEELANFLANHSMHKTYPYTRDTADQVILLQRNATAWNEGVAEIASLPTEFRVQDYLEEFAKEPDDDEKRLYKELGLTRMDGK